MDLNFDPAATLSPDDPLQAWLADPAMAEFVKQKALEHAQNTLAYTEPDVPPQPYPGYRMPERGLDPNVPALRGDDEFSGSPNKGPLANIGVAAGVRDPINAEPHRLYPAETAKWRAETPLPPSAAPTPLPPVVTPPPPTDVVTGSPLDPEEIPSVPLPKERPAGAPGSTDVSAAKKKPTVEDATGDFAKTLAGLKPLQPPPVNPVGTPSVRSSGNIAAPNIQNLLQLFGAQARPDPLTTLGRLLVAGKA